MVPLLGAEFSTEGDTDDEAGHTPEEVGLTVAEMMDQPRSVDHTTPMCPSGE